MDLPVIEPGLIEQPQAVATVPQATLKETALASFAPIVAHMTTLAARYRDVAYDLRTPKGMKEAKAARLVLREEGRYAVQRLQKRLKDEANDLKRTIDEKADEAIAIVAPVENAIHKTIEDRETEIEAEKEQARLAEQARQEGHRSAIEAMRICIDRCGAPGMTSARVANGMDKLRAVPVGPEFEDFQERAQKVKDDTLAAMQRVHDDLLAREQEAARLEAQRLENERVAAENARIAAEAAAESARVAAAAAAEKAAAEALMEQARQMLADAEAKRLADEESEAARLRAITPAAPVATAAAILGTAETPEPQRLEAAQENTDGLEAAAPSQTCAGEAPRHEAVSQDAVGEPTADPGVGSGDSERGADVASAGYGSCDDPQDAPGLSGLGYEVGPGVVAAAESASLEGFELRADQPAPIIDEVAAADIAGRDFSGLGPEDQDDDEGGIDAKPSDVVRDRALDLKALIDQARSSKFPKQPKMVPEWFAALYAAVDALAVAAGVA